MKIVQISSVIEGSYNFNEKYMPNEHATLFGLGDDGQPYYWGLTKNDMVRHDEPDEDGAMYHYEKEWAWKPYQC